MGSLNFDSPEQKGYKKEEILGKVKFKRHVPTMARRRATACEPNVKGSTTRTAPSQHRKGKGSWMCKVFCVRMHDPERLLTDSKFQVLATCIIL